MRCSRRISAPPARTMSPPSPSYRGRKMLWAEQGPFGLALAAVDTDQRDAFGPRQRRLCRRQRRLAGFCPQRRADLAIRLTPGRATSRWSPNCRATPCWRSASAAASKPPRTLAVSEPDAAVRRNLLQRQIDDWQHWHRLAERAQLGAAGGAGALRDQFRVSAMVLRSHRDKTYPGAMVASLSIPWGNTRQRTRRLPPGVAARSGAMRRRAAGAGRGARGAQHTALPDRDPTRGRALGPEPVAWRHALLAGHAARRDRLARAAGGATGRTQRARRHRGRAT